jgi:hypothetical protein
MKRHRLAQLTVLTLFVLLSAAPSLLAQGHGGGCACGRNVDFRADWQIDHPDVSGLRAAARVEFEKWNRYVDVMTFANGDVAVSYNHGINELAFLDSDTLEAVYGIRFGDGTYGITLPRPFSAFGDFDSCHTRPAAPACGTFLESDIALNVEFPLGWDIAGPPSWDTDAPAYYGTTVAHEMGHALGFHHNFTNLSVMNYYEDAAGVYVAASDSAAARSHYSSQVMQVSDLGTYPFYYDPTFNPGLDQPGLPYESTSDVTFSPSSVAPGGQLTIRNVTLENVGTRHLNDVRLRFYLSTDRTYSANDINIGGIQFAAGAPSNAFWDDEGGGMAFTVPASVPSGTYYITAQALYDGGTATDPVTYNNTWSTERTVFVGSGGSNPTGPCVAGTTTLCLQNTRYEVKTQATFNGVTHPGHQTKVSDQFGYFSVPGFTGDPSNIEIFIKITGLVNGKNWIFYGGISGFTVDIDVRDTVTNKTKRYTIPGGSYQGGADFSTFP